MRIKKPKFVQAVTLAAPVRLNQRFDNIFGYDYMIMHAVLLGESGQTIGGVFETSYNVMSYFYEDYWEICEAYAKGTWDVKAETAKREKQYEAAVKRMEAAKRAKKPRKAK